MKSAIAARLTGTNLARPAAIVTLPRLTISGTPWVPQQGQAFKVVRTEVMQLALRPIPAWATLTLGEWVRHPQISSG